MTKLNPRIYEDALKIQAQLTAIKTENERLREVILSWVNAHEPEERCACDDIIGDCLWHRSYSLVKGEYLSMWANAALETAPEL